MDESDVEVTRLSMLTALDEQPWWSKYANTVTTAVSVLVMLAWLLISSGTDFPGWLDAVITAVLAAGNVLGVSKTRNGVTPALVDKVAPPAQV